jgi:large subunit ribosomal protein L6
MSRIGKQPIAIPQGIVVQIEGNTVRVSGPKGQLNKEFHPDMIIRQENSYLYIERPADDKLHRSLHGLTRTLLNNMILGVTGGFEKTLELSGVGYRASKQGKKLVLAMGYSHPVEILPEEGLEIEVPVPTKVVVKGIDKEKVGNLAAKIRGVREPEPYKGKGIRYEGEKIRRKAGKAGVKGKK